MIARFNTLGFTVGLKTISQFLKVMVTDVQVGTAKPSNSKNGRLRKVLTPKPKVPPHKRLLTW